MRKTLITSVSALALTLGGAAFADESVQSETDTQSNVEVEQSAETDGLLETGVAGDAELGVETGSSIDAGEASVLDVDLMSEDTLIDTDGYTAAELMSGTVIGTDGHAIADVNDLVLDPDNKVTKVLVDVGGFLGLGEKVVALDANELQVTEDEDGDVFIVTEFTEQDLEQMAPYDAEADADARMQSEIEGTM